MYACALRHHKRELLVLVCIFLPEIDIKKDQAASWPVPGTGAPLRTATPWQQRQELSPPLRSKRVAGPSGSRVWREQAQLMPPQSRRAEIL